MICRALLPLLLFALLGACASVPPAPGCQRLGRDGRVCLLPPADLPAVSAVHLVSIHREGRDNSFIGRLHIDARTLQLAGFSLFGTSLFTIHYDGGAIVSQPENDRLHADTLVVMLELALANPTTMRSHLHGLTLKISRNDRVERRDVFEHGQLIAHIERSVGPLDAAYLKIEIPPIKLSVQMTPLRKAVQQP